MIILMGVAGAGKSEQGRLLADEAGYPWLSTGELLRVLITGKRRHEMLTGILLSDEEVINVVKTVINLIDVSKEFVLDGFPRSIPQADWVVSQIKQHNFRMTAVFHFQASEEVVLGRLKKRGRSDDNEEAIVKRFSEYRTSTLPIIKHFQQEDIPIYDIDASKTPMEVHKDIMTVLNKINSEKK